MRYWMLLFLCLLSLSPVRAEETTTEQPKDEFAELTALNEQEKAKIKHNIQDYQQKPSSNIQ